MINPIGEFCNYCHDSFTSSIHAETMVAIILRLLTFNCTAPDVVVRRECCGIWEHIHNAFKLYLEISIMTFYYGAQSGTSSKCLSVSVRKTTKTIKINYVTRGTISH